MLQVKFKEWNCNVEFAHYGNYRRAICLQEVGTGEPVATATVNLHEHTLVDGHVFIKDYGENAGMLETLMKAGIVSKPISTIAIGDSEAHECKLLVNPHAL